LQEILSILAKIKVHALVVGVVRYSTVLIVPSPVTPTGQTFLNRGKDFFQ